MFTLAMHTANHAPHIAVLIVPALVFGPMAVIWSMWWRVWRHDDAHTSSD